MVDLQTQGNSNNLPAISLDRAILILIILLAALLRFWLLADKSLGGDEINIVNRALGLKVSATGNGILITPVLQLFMMLLGSEDVVMRLPGLFLGILTIPLLYKAGQLVLNSTVGLVSAFLLAISVLHLNYSQETHSYSLFTFLSLLAFYCLWQAVHKNRRADWLGLAAVLSLNILAHLFAVFILANVILGFGIMWLYYRYGPAELTPIVNRRTIRNFSLAIMPAFVVCLYILLDYLIPRFTGDTPARNTPDAVGEIEMLQLSPFVFIEVVRSPQLIIK